MYFEQPDKDGHSFGPESAEVTAAIGAADATLGSLVAGLRAAGLWGADAVSSGVNIVITSDHGMASISPERVITLNDYVDATTFTTSDTSPAAAIWPNDPDADTAAMVAALNADPHLTAYLKADVPERLHYSNNPRVAPVIAIADEGYSIRRTDASPAENYCCGNHGYDNALASMRALFVARGPGFR
jgi:predicted AlkP superfamily pyrophosphatase or phosphodiesterase